MLTIENIAFDAVFRLASPIAYMPMHATVIDTSEYMMHKTAIVDRFLSNNMNQCRSSLSSFIHPLFISEYAAIPKISFIINYRIDATNIMMMI
jgi:hypothetical protein